MVNSAAKGARRTKARETGTSQESESPARARSWGLGIGKLDTRMISFCRLHRWTNVGTFMLRVRREIKTIRRRVRRGGGRSAHGEISNLCDRLDRVRKARGEGGIEISLKSHQHASKMPCRRGCAEGHGMIRGPCSAILRLYAWACVAGVPYRSGRSGLLYPAVVSIAAQQPSSPAGWNTYLCSTQGISAGRRLEAPFLTR